MLKLKCYYYKFWRELRSIKESMGNKPREQLWHYLNPTQANTLRYRVMDYMIHLNPEARRLLYITEIRNLYLQDHPGDDIPYTTTYQDRPYGS